MNISISGHHIAVTEAMKEAVMDKIGKVEKNFEQIQSIKIILSLDNHHSEANHAGHDNNKAEAILRLSGQEMFVSAAHDDMYQAISEMADKLDRKLRKYRKKTEKQNRINKRQTLEMLIPSLESNLAV